MNKQIEKRTEPRVWDLPREVLDRGREMAGRTRDIWLAGLGAVAVMEEEGSTLFNNLVERGREVEERGRKQIESVRGELTTRQKEVVQAVDESVYEPLVGALRRFGVSTRAEVRELAVNVETLADRVDELLGKLVEEPVPAENGGRKQVRVFSVVPREEGWAIDKEGRERAVSVHPTKEEALERARALAHESLPSRLDVYKKDGSIQDSFAYTG